jgi:4-hydroxy-tetrahydrodipicolinate synthase
MAQTGCASLADTIDLTRHAFGVGLNKVTVIPPFFFKGISDGGLFEYYRQIIEEAVPTKGSVMLYHIPQVTHVPLSFSLIDRLLNTYGKRIGGIKDSAGDLGHLKELCRRFPQISVFTGNDQLILDALQAGAAGCVTGVVNTFAPLAAAIIQAFRSGNRDADGYQQQLTMVWNILDRYQPYTSLMKGLAALRYQDISWLNVRPPLDPMSPEQLERMVCELRQVGLPEAYSWIRRPCPVS